MPPNSSHAGETLLQYLRQKHPAIPLLTPEDNAEFDEARLGFISRPHSTPLAIACPETVADVQILVRAARTHSIDLVVRGGGCGSLGDSQVDGALTIDVKRLASITVDKAKSIAHVGGGVLQRDLVRALEGEGVMTPVGHSGGVGYATWATLGGYGPFSGMYGLGVDQIVGAKLVNGKGELVIIDNGHELLAGLRGGGGAFGVIVELTVNVYPFHGMLSGTVLYAPGDLAQSWKNLAATFQGWHDEGALPAQLYLQPCLVLPPHVGPVAGMAMAWTVSVNDENEAAEWFAKIVAVNAVLPMGPQKLLPRLQSMSATAFVEANEKMVPSGVLGGIYSLSARRLTTQTAAVLAKYSGSRPSNRAAILLPNFRTTRANEETVTDSVFPLRGDHVIVQFMAIADDEEVASKTVEWAREGLAELRSTEPDNILGEGYVAMPESDKPDYCSLYGKHYETLIALKRKYDPETVFRHAVPRLS